MGSAIKESALTTLVLLCLHGFSYGQMRFDNVTDEAGIDHVHTSVIYMGGGVAFFDFNNDGFDDIFLTGGIDQDKLYKNLGDFRFEDVTEAMGLRRSNQEHSMGVTVGDINNDGFQDIFVPYGIGDASRLYLNVGGERFEDITISGGVENYEWAMGATFGDVNMDGFLDLYVINWVEKFEAIENGEGTTVGFAHQGYPNNLYINNGDNTFTEMSAEYAVDNQGCGLAVLFTDYNNDAIPDIYIANDFGAWVEPNTLLMNDFPQTKFSNLSAASGLDAQIYGMGIAAGDFDRDGLIDYYTTNIGRNVLYKNNGDGTFADVTTEAKVENEKANDLNTTGWGAVFADLDNDGYEDLLVSNGYVPAAKFIETAVEDPNKLFMNSEDGTFIDMSDEYNLSDTNISRGVAVSDLDNDGDIDFLFTFLNTDIASNNIEGNVLLYQNNSVNANHYLKIKLEGTESNRNGYNARVKVYGQGEQYIREHYSGSSHNSQNSSILHFGLGETAEIDSVVVTWVGGKKEVVTNLSVDTSYLIKEGTFDGKILGCLDPMSSNYNPNSEVSFGCIESLVTAFEDTLEEQNSIIFPNPSRNSIHFYRSKQNTAYTIEVLSLEGNLIYKENIKSVDRLVTIDISDFKPGVYLLRSVSDRTSSIQRIIKSK